MNKTVLLILIGLLAAVTTACSTSSDNADSQKELDKNAANTTPVQIDASTTQANKTETGEFADLKTEKTEKKNETVEIAALIPPTNPDVRVRTSVRGRQDPFSLIPLTPKIKVEQKEVAKQPATQPTQNRFTEEQNYRPREDFSAPPMEVVDPTLAKNVMISGLYEANGQTKLIIQESEENTSRYVDIGEYIANGQVLVKSVDRNNLPTPLVILEESGVEVSKSIGEVPEGDSNS
jgi:autotransporter translocation and assembly factor TamB